MYSFLLENIIMSENWSTHLSNSVTPKVLLYSANRMWAKILTVKEGEKSIFGVLKN